MIMIKHTKEEQADGLRSSELFWRVDSSMLRHEMMIPFPLASFVTQWSRCTSPVVA